MDKLLNPLLAPFSETRAAETTTGAVAVTYALIGVIVGVVVLGR